MNTIEAFRKGMRSGFPEIAYRERTEQNARLWLTSYLDDLVTRDAAVLDQRKDPAKLRHYLQVLALNNAGLPSDSTLYAAASINAKTAAGYDQLLLTRTCTCSTRSRPGEPTGSPLW